MIRSHQMKFLKKMGWVSFLFFLGKGLLWLALLWLAAR